MDRFQSFVVSSYQPSFVNPGVFWQRTENRLAKLACAFCLGMAASTARSQPNLVANFDDLTEGGYGSVISDGGITFSNLDERISNGHSSFAIEMTTSNLLGFSLPNYLTFEGYSPGPGYSLNRFGSMTIGFSGLASAASLDVIGNSLFGATTSGGLENTLTLEAFRSGILVATSQSVGFDNPDQSVIGFHLSVSGVFDSLQLVSAGPVDAGENFIGIDNVEITPVPEPDAGMLAGLSFAGMALLSKTRPIRDIFGGLALRRVQRPDKSYCPPSSSPSSDRQSFQTRLPSYSDLLRHWRCWR